MKRFLIASLGILIIGLASCKKEGCTNSSASNFDGDAKEDNGTCQFSGTVMTSIGYSEKDNLELDNIEVLEVYIDNSYSGLINVDSYYVSQSSSCNSPQNAPRTVNWVGENSNSYFVDYKNQATGQSIFSTDVVVYSNQCGYVDFSY